MEHTEPDLLFLRETSVLAMQQKKCVEVLGNNSFHTRHNNTATVQCKGGNNVKNIPEVDIFYWDLSILY